VAEACSARPASSRPKPRACWPIALPLGLLALLPLAGLWSRPQLWPRNPTTTTGYHVGVNTADAAELALLPGVGPITARKIVAHRRAHGPFTGFEQLKAVHGIGDKTVARFKPYATLETPDQRLKRRDLSR